MDPSQLPTLVMRSIENAQKALMEGDAERTVSLLTSTDALCTKNQAPPPIHALALRVMAEAHMSVGRLDDAREALNRGYKMCKKCLERNDLNDFMKADINNRSADVQMTLGELELAVDGREKEARRAFRKVTDHYNSIPGCTEREASGYGRVALVCFKEQKWQEALDALQEQDRLLRSTPAGESSGQLNKLLANCMSNQGACWVRLGNIDLAMQLWEQALPLAEQAGDEQEANNIKGLMAGGYE